MEGSDGEAAMTSLQSQVEALPAEIPSSKSQGVKRSYDYDLGDAMLIYHVYTCSLLLFMLSY